MTAPDGRTEGQVERTVLFADIAGSTRLYGQFGDAATKQLLSDCLDLMESIVKERKGHVARRIGDEILCTFAQPNDAALAAMRMQAQVSEGNLKGLFPTAMRIRVGFEHGLIIEADGALYGNVVHTAARIAALAKARQILLSAATAEHLNPALRNFIRFYRRTMLKGQSGEQEIHELVWNLEDSTISSKQSPGAAPKRSRSLQYVELMFRGSVVRADVDRPQVDVGRDPSCDLCVSGASVSQQHARIIWDRGAAQVVDVSTNGTLVEPAGGAVQALHHGRAPLRGEGVLVFGDAEDRSSCAIVRFRCG